MINPTILERLPDAARTKLTAIDGARFDAADAAHSARTRLNQTRDLRESGRLRAVVEAQEQRANTLSALSSCAQQWIDELPSNVTVELAPPITAQPRPDETLITAIDRTRDELAALK